MKKLSLAVFALACVANAGVVSIVSGPLSTDINNFIADPTISGIATITTTPGFTSGGQLFVFSQLVASFTGPVTDIGMIESAGLASPTLTFTSATFDNGDTFNTVTPLTPGTFFGLHDTAPFSSVTMNFNFTGSPSISDFEFSQPAGTPEPSTAVLMGPALLLLALGGLAGKRLVKIRAR